MNRKRRAIAQAAIGILLLCGCVKTASTGEAASAAKSWPPGDHELSIAAGGLERRYAVHVPPGYGRGQPWPVVIMFHGGGGTARAAMRQTDFAGQADQEGFLAVFPEGTAPDPSRPGRFLGNPQTWNDGSDRKIGAVERHVADVEFVFAMIADLKKRFNADKRRIYATGFSNGASMTFRIARELSTVIAAAAPVAGADWLPGKRPERAVPLLYITGTADPLNPFEGGEIHIGAKSYGKKPPVHEMIAGWVQLHGCRPEPRVVYDKQGARGVAYDCADGRQAVVLYTIDGHGHHWPGGKSALPQRTAGKNTAKLRATEIIWNFFIKRSLSD